MRNDNRFFEDLAKVANGAISSFSGLKQDIELRLQAQMERMLNRMNLVSREEYEMVKAMAVHAREEQARLEARIIALENALAKAASSSQQK